MEKNKDIYKMKLHEAIKLDGYPDIVITRVPGGWIYGDWNIVGGCFIPYNKEFHNN